MAEIATSTTRLPPRVLKSSAAMLRAVAHPARLKIVELLMNHAECAVGDVAGHLKLSPHVVSGHLKQLRAVKVVAGRRNGRSVYYRLVNPDAAGVIQCIRRHYFRQAGFQYGEAI
jgi:DNA-binding transcriptional ArsR family regulator